MPAFLPSYPAPFYVYMDPGSIVFLPGIYSGQQVASWQAPNQPALTGAQLVAQAVVLPLTAVAPATQLPPGWRFELR